jgi:hypothetical protein
MAGHTRKVATIISASLVAGSLVMVGLAPATEASTPIRARVEAIVPGSVHSNSGQLPATFNRNDQVEIRVQVRPTAPVICTVALKYRGKIFGGGTIEGPVQNGRATISASAYSRTRTTRGVVAALRCVLAKAEGEIAEVPIQTITTEGP